MKKITVIIVDDERLSRELINKLLEKFPDIQVIGECSDGFEAVKMIQEKQPDVLFLDIQMPKLTGFEVLELLEEKPFVIFSTAYDSYALEAFKVNALDYLLKPYSDERFEAAVRRAIEAVNTGSKSNVPAKGIEPPSAALDRIAVKDNAQIYIIPTDEISRIEAMDDYIVIYHQVKKHYKKQTLKQLEKLLPAGKFVRVHRSHLINIDFVKKIEPLEKEGYRMLLKDGTVIPVSKSGYANLKEIIGLKK